jgi:hypothetical protein
VTAIWLLTTRGRPDACQAVLDACEETGMTSPGLVYVDETVDQYRKIRLPSNWRIRRVRKWGSIAASMRYTLKQYPDATQYGWLADDQFPLTPNWDEQLERSAGRWNISMGRDNWMSETGWAHQTGGICFTAGLCWGGDLIRATGWWALPGVKQGGIDGAWNDIAGSLDLTRYLPSVTIEHRTWKIGLRDKDETDQWVKHGETYIATDLARYEEWTRTERAGVEERIMRAKHEQQH